MSAPREPVDDVYARTFMGGDDVVFFDKVRAPWWLNSAMVLTGAAGAIASIYVGSFLAAGAIAVMSTAAAALLLMLRVTVTTTDVHVQYGTTGPVLALADIAAVDVADYEMSRWGGWGIRRRLARGMAYSIPGRGGKVVRITMQNGKIIEVTSEQPAALRSAILEARAALTTDLAGVREQLGVRPAVVADDVGVDVAHTISAKR